MRLDFSRAALVEALVHILIMAAAASLNTETPQIWSDSPKTTVQDVA